ncbi:MAG: hypothetical protein FD145_1530 [Candidatus Saganbacteria bacterium]|uniref:BIG2 domain-containing protein n=1 Tax=Candidatus Saganbacteria bacterium TaxID=2575572 RepID=A0A833KZM1_UNCSA|nr:MAG: hypothetical protein FD145_1530 [Candidatus Saganbacteria bacterium]
MKKTILFVLIFVCGLVLFLSSGCGKVIDSSNNILEPNQLIISPSKSELLVGETQQYTLSPTLDAQSISWEVVGAIGEIDAKGLFVATKEGQGEIVANYNGASVRISIKVTRIDVSTELNEAKSDIENGDIDGAYDNYNKALSKDPTNTEANFGAAMLDVLQVAIDSNTRNIAASKFNVTLPTNFNTLFKHTATTKTASILSLSSFAQATTTPAIMPSEVQEYIKKTLLPALDKALNRLAIVEANPDFKFVVTRKMSKREKDYEVDLGEVYSLDATVCLIKAMLCHVSAYNWDYFTDHPLNEPNFATLKSDGSANMEAARQAYDRMTIKWIAGINYIDAETDDQSDDIIPKFNDPALKNNCLKYLGLVKNSLENGATNIEIKPGANAIVDLKTFFSSPISDLKKFITANGIYSNNFPPDYDFTLNGLFPGFKTYDNWASFCASIK